MKSHTDLEKFKISAAIGIVIIVSSSVVTGITIQNAQGKGEIAYRTYVDPLPSEASYASDVIDRAITAWKKANPSIHFAKVSGREQADLEVKWATDTAELYSIARTLLKPEKLGILRNVEPSGMTLTPQLSILPRTTILVTLGSNNECSGEWEPNSSSMLARIIEHEIGHFLGFNHSPNTHSIMYPSGHNQYGTVVFSRNLTAGQHWFVPLCTDVTKTVVSYDYTATTSDTADEFSIYFLPSVEEFHKEQMGQLFHYYTNNGCFGKFHGVFTSTCRVANGGGFLIVAPRQLTYSPVQVTVKLTEEPSSYLTELEATEVANKSIPTVWDIFNSTALETIAVQNEFRRTSDFLIPNNTTIIGARILGIKESVTSPNSVVIFLEQASIGTLTMDYLRSVIDTKTGASDGKLILLTDGSKIDFNEIYTLTDRHITVNFTDGADQILITGIRTMNQTISPLQRAVVSEPELVDQTGAKLTEAKVGSQVLIQSEIANNQTKAQPFAYIVQVKDEDGVTVALSWLTGSLLSKESLKASQSWIPDAAGRYTIDVFVWESVDKPNALSPQRTTIVTVTA